MKLKLSLAAAAVAMAVSVPAFAIQSPTTGDGGLFLTAWDSSASGATQAYARDLGMTMDQFLASPNVDLSFAADSLFVSTFSGIAASNIQWNIVAGDRVVDPNRLLTTAEVDPGNFSNSAQNSAILNKIVPLVNDINARTLNALGGVALTDPADLEWPGGSNWKQNFGGVISTIDNAATLGNSLGFYLITQNGLTETATLTNVLQSQFHKDSGATATNFLASPASTWTLAADGSLSYDGTANAAAVPVPAAVWLFGSGLAGLVGVARRRQQKAAA